MMAKACESLKPTVTSSASTNEKSFQRIKNYQSLYFGNHEQIKALGAKGHWHLVTDSLLNLRPNKNPKQFPPG